MAEEEFGLPTVNFHASHCAVMNLGHHFFIFSYFKNDWKIKLRAFFPYMITGDPPKQKRSQGNEKKTEDDNITQGKCDFS